MEYFVYRRHVQPIKAVYQDQQYSFESLERAYQHSLLFPLLTVKIIMIPHFLGLAVPATVLAFLHYEGSAQHPL
ncbi:hypothetical protein BSG1_02500 [Bacillus sp. SG-1]|nr:hypothetical protein BSG1_02500 [Bacillus sp. SG-1]